MKTLAVSASLFTVLGSAHEANLKFYFVDGNCVDGAQLQCLRDLNNRLLGVTQPFDFIDRQLDAWQECAQASAEIDICPITFRGRLSYETSQKSRSCPSGLKFDFPSSFTKYEDFLQKPSLSYLKSTEPLECDLPACKASEGSQQFYPYTLETGVSIFSAEETTKFSAAVSLDQCSIRDESHRSTVVEVFFPRKGPATSTAEVTFRSGPQCAVPQQLCTDALNAEVGATETSYTLINEAVARWRDCVTINEPGSDGNKCTLDYNGVGYYQDSSACQTGIGFEAPAELLKNDTRTILDNFIVANPFLCWGPDYHWRPVGMKTVNPCLFPGDDLPLKSHFEESYQMDINPKWKSVITSGAAVKLLDCLILLRPVDYEIFWTYPAGYE